MTALSAIVAAHFDKRIPVNIRLGCRVESCLCPEGRTFFEARGDWMATADRYPTPGAQGGGYIPNNVRLAHALCNNLDGGHYSRNRLTRKQVNQLVNAIKQNNKTLEGGEGDGPLPE